MRALRLIRNLVDFMNEVAVLVNKMIMNLKSVSFGRVGIAAFVLRTSAFLFYSSFLILHSSFLYSCQRKAVPTRSTAGPGTSTPIADPASPVVRANNTAFTYFSAKGKAQVTLKGNEQGANLNVRLRRDSIIWVSGSLLGIEGVRAVLTPDSVRVVNRLEKSYFVGGYDYLSRVLQVPVSFAQVQALLLGDYLPAPAGTRPTVVAEAAGQRVSYPQERLSVDRLLSATGRVQQLKLAEAATGRRLTVDYADFRALEAAAGLSFAHDLNVRAEQPKASTTAHLNYNKVTVGERLEFPFSIPKGYAKMK